MRRFRKEFGLKKARILRERLIPVSQRLKIGINRHPLFFCAAWRKSHNQYSVYFTLSVLTSPSASCVLSLMS